MDKLTDEREGSDVLAWMPTAKLVAKQVWWRQREYLELEELEAESMVGLVKVWRSYDPARGKLGPYLLDWILSTFGVGLEHVT